MNKRFIKNIVSLIIIIAVIVGTYFTTTAAKNELGAKTETSAEQIQNMQDNRQGPPDRMGDFNENDENNGKMRRGRPDRQNNSDNNSDNMQTPPEMPSGENSNMQTPPEMPNGENNNGDMKEPFDMKDGQRPERAMQANETQETTSTAKLTFKYYIIFACEAFVLAVVFALMLATKFYKVNVMEALSNSKRYIAVMLGIILLTAVITIGVSFITTKFML